MKLVYILVALAFIKSVLLYKVYHSVPVHELKRRARQGDKQAGRLYKVAAYEATFDVMMWLAAVASAAVLVVWSARTHWWLAVIVMVGGAWLVAWSKLSAGSWAGSAAAFIAPVHAKFLYYAQPVLGPIANLLPPGRRASIHTGLYETRDLLDFLSRQNKQLDNRISQADLEIARNSLTFGDKTVGSIMTPRREVKFAKADDSVGPVLIDELHQTGFSRFPVAKDSAKSAAPQIIGTLYLNNLVGYDGDGKVKDLMKKEVYFINEDASLRQALGAFLKTHHHLLIVVNSFEEMAGVISLEDVLEQILGKQIVDEFDSYENIRAVAAMKAGKDSAANGTLQPDPIAKKVASEPE
jgi:CBS domain containing-hemolysin-like protein